MNRSIRFVVVVVVLLAIAGAVFVVLLRELDRTGTRESVPVLMNPVRDLRVGDWVEYRREGGKIERWDVVEVGEYGYVLRTSGFFPGGQVLDYGLAPPRSMWDMGLGMNFRLLSIRPERITVAGREWSSWRVECDNTLVGRIVSWISDEVPVGLLRRELIRMQPGTETEGGLRPLPRETTEYNYEYLRHGYTDPVESAASGDQAGEEEPPR